MRSREEGVAYEVTVDEKQNKVLVSVELQARRGREACGETKGLAGAGGVVTL